jgi:hypothetical protein
MTTTHCVILGTYKKLKSICSTDLEYLTIKCQPYYLPRELSSVIAMAVSNPPQTETLAVLKELHWTLCKLETTYPEAAFIVAGDFNKTNLRTRLPKFYQHIDCTTRTAKTLNQCYSNLQNAYKALPRPLFGKSDHDFILILPSYRQKLKQEVPVLRTIQYWYDQSESTLQDCFDHMDWDMFRGACENNLDAYMDTVTEFIKKCIGDIVPSVTIKT